MTIFVLTAGTYTPICLLALDGVWRLVLLGLVWGLALCGVLLKLLWMEAPRWLSVVLYVTMGWPAVVAPVWAASALVPEAPVAAAAGAAAVVSKGTFTVAARSARVKPVTLCR